MASQYEEPVNFNPDDEDIRGDGKKKKFKPLSAMRKLFSGKSKRKKEAVVTVKAQSTTTLHQGYVDHDDDEDEGGFKNYQGKASTSLAGNRSISEDSVFSPNTAISTFPTSAVSEESVPSAQLQSELLSKLIHRRSQYSDDDHDDGLPRSPVQPITTADVIHGNYFKPVTSGKKSNGQGSAQSLISVDSSENEEDNLFNAKWKNSVPSKKSAKMSEGRVPDEPLDFSNIQKTEVLKSTAAKDRISIKPQSRRASRLSRKKRETSQSLPSLSEESPQKVRGGDSDISAKKNNASKDVPSKKPQEKGRYTKAIDISNASVSTPSVAFLSSSAPSYGVLTEFTSPSSVDNNLDTPFGKSASPVEDVKKTIEVKKDTFGENINRSSVKARAAEFKPSVVTPKPEESPKSEGTSLKVTDANSKITSSPREDYKLKRQNRCKTIPAGNTEDENAAKVQRAVSQRVQNTTIYVQSPAKEKQEKVTPTSEPPSQTSLSGSVKKQDGSKLVKQDSSSKIEPDWISMVRRKKEEQTADNNKEKENEDSNKIVSKPAETPTSISVSNAKSAFSSIKSVFNSSNSNSNNNSQDIKRGSIDIAKGAQAKDVKNVTDVSKNEETPKEATSSSSKRSSIDIGSVRRDSMDVNVSELNSVKAMTSSFSNASKRDSIASRWNPSNNDDTKASVPSPSPAPSSSTTSYTDRAKVFSGASASSTSTSSSSSASQPSPANGAASTKPPTGSITQSRFGSVKTSPTKSVEVKSMFATRGGSVKAASHSPSSSSSSKPESISSTSKLDSNSCTSEPKAVTSCTNNIGSHSVTVSPSRPPPHPNSLSSSSSSSSSSQSTQKLGSPTNQSASSFVKPVSIGVKSSPFSVAKSSASTPASASNNSSFLASPSKSSTATTTSPPSSSSSSSSSATTVSSSQTKNSPIRSRASFTVTSAHTAPSTTYNRSNVISKSPSMKVKEVPKQEKETTTTTPNIPAWRANLAKKDVKIEIIEKSNNSNNTTSSTPSPLSVSSQNKNENGKKIGDSSRVAQMAKVFQFQK